MARAAATPPGFAREVAERSKRGPAEGEGRESTLSPPPSRRSLSFFDAAPADHRASLIALSPLAAVDPRASLAGTRPAAGPLAKVAEAAAEAKRGGKKLGHITYQNRTRYVGKVVTNVQHQASNQGS